MAQTEEKTLRTFAFEPAPRAVAGIAGGGEISVHRIYCVGRNYAAHAREMGGDPTRELPFFFQKPADALVASGTAIAYPSMTADYQPEVELVLAIAKGGTDIAVDAARDHIFGYAVGLDMTRRDLQGELRKAGRPWDMAKGFDHSAPCGPFRRVRESGFIERGAIWLKVNGAVRQTSDIAQMTWNPYEVIHWLSRFVALKPGDLIYTGTPEGVSAVARGDRLLAHIDGLPELEIGIAG